MTRGLLGAAVCLTMTCQAVAWPVPFGAVTGNRTARGAGTFPRWQALALMTDSPITWLVALPGRRLAAVDREGALLVFELTPSGLRTAVRYGGVASPAGPPAAVQLDQDQSGVALVAPDGRLLVWSDGTLRGYDVGGPLSTLTCPTPVSFEGRAAQDLLAVTQDGAVVLISGLAAGGPRAVARLEVGALRDARIAVADLDGDGAIEAVVLSGAVEGLPGSPSGAGPEAGTVTVVRLRPYGLEQRARFALPPPGAFEDSVPVLAPIPGSARPMVVLARSTAGKGVVPVVLALRNGGLTLLAEGVTAGQGRPQAARSETLQRRLEVVGTADLSGDGVPEVVAVAAAERDGVLMAYRRAAGALIPRASAAGYAGPAAGSRTPAQIVIADLDGDGRPEVVLARHSTEVLSALELRHDRFVERWAVDFKASLTSNLVAADLDGDGLLDLAVATRRGLHVFLSVR